MEEARNTRGRTHPALLVGLPVLAMLVTGVALWLALVKVPADEAMREQERLLQRMMGLGRPVANRLANGLIDRDGDGVADPPTDRGAMVDPATVRFSYIATEEPEKYRDAFADFTQHLSKVTGRPVEYVMFRSVDEQLRAMRERKIHVIGVNTGNVPKAVNAVGFVPVGMIADGSGNAYHQSVIIVPMNSAAKKLEDLRRTDLTLTDAGSNSGYRAPLLMMRNAGMMPLRDYTVRYSGGQDESVMQIASGDATAAAVASDVLAKHVAMGHLGPEGVGYRALAASQRYPSAAIGFVYNLEPALAGKVREAVLGYAWQKGSVFPAGSKFVAVKYKEDFEIVRRVDDEMGIAHRVK